MLWECLYGSRLPITCQFLTCYLDSHSTRFALYGHRKWAKNFWFIAHKKPLHITVQCTASLASLYSHIKQLLFEVDWVSGWKLESGQMFGWPLKSRPFSLSPIHTSISLHKLCQILALTWKLTQPLIIFVSYGYEISVDFRYVVRKCERPSMVNCTVVWMALKQ